MSNKQIESVPFSIMENKYYELDKKTVFMINSMAKSSFSEEKLSNKEIRYFSLKVSMSKFFFAVVIIGALMTILSSLILYFVGYGISEIFNSYLFFILIVLIGIVPFAILVTWPSIKIWQSLVQGSLQSNDLIDDTFTFSGFQSLKFDTKNWQILNIFKIKSYYLCQGIVTNYKTPFRHIETVYIPMEVLTIDEKEKIQNAQKILNKYRKSN